MKNEREAIFNDGEAIFDDMEAVLKSSILSRAAGPAGRPGGWILLRIRLSKAKLLGFVLPLAFAWQKGSAFKGAAGERSVEARCCMLLLPSVMSF